MGKKQQLLQPKALQIFLRMDSIEHLESSFVARPCQSRRSVLSLCLGFKDRHAVFLGQPLPPGLILYRPPPSSSNGHFRQGHQHITGERITIEKNSHWRICVCVCVVCGVWCVVCVWLVLCIFTIYFVCVWLFFSFQFYLDYCIHKYHNELETNAGVFIDGLLNGDY